LAYFAAAMSRNRRIALVVAAVAVAVLAFVIAQPGDDEDGGEQAATTPAQTETETAPGDGGTPAPTEAETEEEPPPPPEPEVTRIQMRDGSVVGGAEDIEVTRGDTVRIVVTSDAPDEIHLHGYDITRTPEPGKPARFQFRADAEGAFEIESHVAEDAGLDPLVARLVVEPS
jgi:FtsP/CotA-like multicopper oxidase with cupredoxin domain